MGKPPDERVSKPPGTVGSPATKPGGTRLELAEVAAIDADPNAPHDEECNWWHGGICDCKEVMRESLAREHHCHECDFMNSYTGSTPCNCKGRCICDRIEEEGCPCIGVIEP